MEARNRQVSGPKVPAKGLTLVSIELEQELPEIWQTENQKFSYRVLQQDIKEKKIAYIEIERSVEEEYLRLVERITRQVFRNGARTIYLQCYDREKVEVFWANEYQFQICDFEQNGQNYTYVCYSEDYK